MFRPKDKPPPTNFRLPKLPTILKDSDLQYLLQEAGSRRGVTIELPFLSGGATFMLTVKLSDDSYEPTWAYYRGDDDRAQLVWKHPTGDINLVLNLCAHETGQEETSYTAAGKLLTPGLPNSQAAPRISYSNLDLDDMGDLQTTTLNGPPMGKPSTLEGDLSNMQVTTLLQSISMSKMTGCLRLTNHSEVACIWFDDGTPVHAETTECKGDTAIVEIITWEDGEFNFYPNEKSESRTVKRRVDGLLMEGITLLDQNKYLKEKGLKTQSYLIRTQDKITEEQFKAALTKGAPLEFESQKQFYGYVDNNSTLLDVLRRMPMTKNEWLPLMFNMVSCGLVTLSDTPPVGVSVTPMLSVPHFDIDRPSIQGVIRNLSRQETGLLNYPAFLFLLEQEFQKSAALGLPLSVVVFEPKLRVGEALQTLPMQFQKELFKRIETAKRSFDILAHFETFDYAMFLPNTQAKTAKVFAARLLEMLAADPFIPRPFGNLTLFFGIASAPEDTMELPVLLSAAREAKRRSVETSSPVTTCKELGQREIKNA